MSQISIIVPVYDVELYLRKCIDSILAQTLTDFECILIDDGSPDNCPAICEEYAAKDSRIIVIHQKNAGVSAARNAGLDIARGEWIGFVDSDDWCDPGMFEFLLRNSENNEADISICGFHYITTDSNSFIKIKKCHNLLMNSMDAIKKLFSIGYFGAYSWNKLIKKRLLSDGNDILRYDESIHNAEDRLFLLSLFIRAKRIFYSPKVYYNYRQNQNSINGLRLKGGITEKNFTVFDACNKMLELKINKKIKHRILSYEGHVAANTYLRYIAYIGFSYDDKLSFLRNIVKKNIKYIFLYATFKQKLYSCLVFLPSIFYLYYRVRRKKL